MSSFDLAQMEWTCGELQKEILHFTLTECKEIVPARLLLTFKKEEEEKRLLLCFEKPFLRFHLIKNTPYSIQDIKEHPLSSYLVNASLTSLHLLNQDRLLQLEFQNNRKLFLIGEFFNKHPNYYLVDQNKEIILSLYPSKNPLYHPPAHPSFKPARTHTPLLSSSELEVSFNQLEKDFRFQQEKNSLISQLNQRLKQSQKRHDHMQQELNKCLLWKDIQHEGELLKAHFSQLKRGLSTITVWDWEQEKERTIQIDPQQSPQEIIAKRFHQSKKSQKGIPTLQIQLEKSLKEIESIKKRIEEVSLFLTFKELQHFKKSFTPTPPRSSPIKAKTTLLPPYYEYRSQAGIPIWVGKSARDNEKLTFQWAHGSDWWLHVLDFPGSHVIIKANKGKEPDHETLLDAMQLALHYSKAKTQGEAEICVTQRKFISRLKKGKPGQVQVAKQRKLFIRFDKERLQKLKERQQKNLFV